MRKFHLLLTFVALSLVTTSLWATPTGVKGQLSCGFSVSDTKKVYFSQGNLQYNSNNQTWQFASEQYEYIGEAPGNTNVTADGLANNMGVADMFGWVGASSSWTGTKQYGVIFNWNYNMVDGYGTSKTESLKSDWGTLKISNGGNKANSGWRTLTSDEWAYLGNTRSGNKASTVGSKTDARWVAATVNGVSGLILFPDGGSFVESDFSTINISCVNYPSGRSVATTCDASHWAALEAKGCVFLPAAGYRDTDTRYNRVGEAGYYWTSTPYSNDVKFAGIIDFSSSNSGANVDFSINNSFRRNWPISVRLVKDATNAATTAIITTNPTAKSGLTYTGSAQTLVNAGVAGGGTMVYRKGASGSFNISIPTATNAGTYQVYYRVEGAGCFNNSSTKSVSVTIAKAPFTPSVTITATANNFTYDGSAHDLLSVDIDGDLDGGTMQYSTDGTNWSTTIPTATNAGNYTVHYKVVPADPTNYEDYIPAESPVEVTVAKAPYTPSGTYSVTANDLTYDGSDQPLVSLEGSVTDGTVWYKLEPFGEWTTEIPTGNNAGDYSVSYKVVPTDPNYEEYIPTPSNTINVTIAAANIVMPAIETTLIYTGSPQPLLDITGIVGGTIKYSVDGNEPWLDVCPSETEIGTYDVWYKVVPNNANYNAIAPTKVTVTIDDPYPFVADNADPTAKLEDFYNDGNPMSLKIKRSIVANDEYNTICLPFSLDASALAASPLAGFNRLKTLRGAKVTGIAPDLSIDILVEDATTIEAGIPYLISYPAGDNIVDPVFHDVTVTTTTPNATAADGVTFQGMFAQVHIDPYASERDEDYLFLGANSQLMWPASSQTDSSIKMRGFRAYFIIDRSVITPALAPKGTRARIVDASKTATGIENASATFGESEKILENGVLYIIRNGVRYNAQGQIVK
jgi:hypothetical protein